MLGRVSPPVRDALSRVAGARLPAAVCGARRRLLPVRRRRRPAVAGWTADVCRLRAGTARTEQHVAVTPGEAFDAPGFLRLSFATSMETAAKRALAGIHALRRQARRRALCAGRRAMSAACGSVRAPRDGGRRDHVPPDEGALEAASTDGLKRDRRRPDLVVTPGNTAEVCRGHARLQRGARARRARAAPGRATAGDPFPSAAASSCRWRASTRILEIDEENLLAIVEPNVLTGRSAGGRRGARVCSIPPIRRASRSARSAATSPSAPAGRGRSSTAPRDATSWGSRPCLPTGEVIVHRRQDREERRRLRPHAIAGRVRRARWRS